MVKQEKRLETQEEENGKTPGSDEIPAELLKGSEDMVSWFTEFPVKSKEERVEDDCTEYFM